MYNSNPIEQQPGLVDEIKQLLDDTRAAITAHYYVGSQIQDLAESTGGYVGDSLGMAQFGHCSTAMTLIVAGVRFMGESAKILTPEKKVLMPTLAADCSLDICCPAEKFSQFCQAHPSRTVVVYANTSAQIKALADWVVTSSNAVAIISHLQAKGEKIIWASDSNLGGYIQKQTGADMLLWAGSCIVHDKFEAAGIIQLKTIHPEAAVLVHPESHASVVELADVTGSTTRLIEASATLPNPTFIVATEPGVLHRMQRLSPHKRFIVAPTQGNRNVRCPWMAMNTLESIKKSLLENREEVILSDQLLKDAYPPIRRMLDFDLKH